MDAAADSLTLAAALVGAVLAGVYFAFDVLVMPALRRRPTAEAVLAMQEINRAALRPGFQVIFFGSAVLAAAAAVLEVITANSATTLTRLSGDALILAAFVITVAVNVPRNNAIAALDPHGEVTPGSWRELERGWSTANRLRTIVAFVGAAALVPTLLL